MSEDNKEQPKMMTRSITTPGAFELQDGVTADAFAFIYRPGHNLDPLLSTPAPKFKVPFIEPNQLYIGSVIPGMDPFALAGCVDAPRKQMYAKAIPLQPVLHSFVHDYDALVYKPKGE